MAALFPGHGTQVIAFGADDIVSSGQPWAIRGEAQSPDPGFAEDLLGLPRTDVELQLEGKAGVERAPVMPPPHAIHLKHGPPQQFPEPDKVSPRSHGNRGRAWRCQASICWARFPVNRLVGQRSLLRVFGWLGRQAGAWGLLGHQGDTPLPESVLSVMVFPEDRYSRMPFRAFFVTVLWVTVVPATPSLR